MQVSGRLTSGAISVGDSRSGFEGRPVTDAVVGLDVGVAEETEVLRGSRFRGTVLLRTAGKVAFSLVLKRRKLLKNVSSVMKLFTLQTLNYVL